MEKALEKIQKLRDELNTILVEREEQVEALLAALIAGVHVLLLGPPGTAKSLLANLLCKSIDGAEYFQWLLTKFSTPEEVFGPISMKGLEEDSYRRITTGKLPTAHIAFLDEIFKSNSAILNALLTLINERRFHNNGNAESVPLLSCVGASNELPSGEELGALYDRFLLRFWIDSISDDNAFCNLLSGSVGNAEPTTKLSLEEIDSLQKALENVEVTKELLETIREIYHELKRKGISASDRRWKSAVQVLKAFALLRGEKEVSTDELEIFADILWDQPQDRKAILEVVSPHANPLNLKALEALDSAKEAYEGWKNGSQEDAITLQANGTLKDILKKIDEDIKDRPENRTKKLRQTRSVVEGYRKELFASLGI